MKRVTSIASLLALAAAGSAMAETRLGETRFEGSISVIGIDEISGGDLDSFFSLDGILAMDLFELQGGTVGIDLRGQYVKHLEGGDDFDTFLPSLTYEVGNSKIWLGQPESAFGSLSSHLNAPKSGMLMIEAYNGSLSISTVLEMEAVDYYGLRYDGNFGNTTVQLAAYDVPDEDVQVYSALAMHRVNNLTFYGAYESIVDGPDSDCSTWFGAEGQFGSLTAGAALLDLGLISPLGKVARVYGSYQVNDALKIGAEYNSYLDISGDHFARAMAEYRFPSAGFSVPGEGYVAGSLMTFGSSSSEAYSLEVGMRF